MQQIGEQKKTESTMKKNKATVIDARRPKESRAVTTEFTVMETSSLANADRSPTMV